MSIQENTFAEACYNQNSIEELEAALQGQANAADMKEWDLTEEQWREQISIALQELKEDAE